MNFLSSEEIRDLYNASIDFSGYKTLNKQTIDLWIKFLLLGFNDLPVGFLARLSDKLTHIISGQENSNPKNENENNLIDFISKDQGFKQIEGEFIISGKNINNEKLFLTIEKIIDKIGTFSKQNLKFTEKDLMDSFALEKEPNDNNFNLKSNLEKIINDSYNKVLEITELINEEDLFEIRNPKLFLSDPRAINLYRVMNKTLKEINFFLIGEVSLKQEDDYILAKYGEEQVLPVGGYDSLINKGDISSLLSSELAYIDPTEKIDYFDYKYMQQELLYYKREEGSIFRIRRSILIDIETDYSIEHEKNLAVLFAFCLSLVEKLINVFNKDIVKISLSFSGDLATSMTYALNFFKFFIKRQKYEQNVFILNKNDKYKAFEDTSYQSWLIAKEPIKEIKFVKLDLPTFDLINTLEEKNRGRFLADIINDIIEISVEYSVI